MYACMVYINVSNSNKEEWPSNHRTELKLTIDQSTNQSISNIGPMH